MPPSRLTLIGGGARSGKSRFALEQATKLGPRRLFVATAERSDVEMAARIDRHRRERDASFRTIELPYSPADALDEPDADVVVIDCLTLYLGNLMVRGDSSEQIEASLQQLAAAAESCQVPVIIVTNEVGLGIVPDNELGRRYRDLAGRAHKELARKADTVYFGALGLMLRLKPSPIAVVA